MLEELIVAFSTRARFGSVFKGVIALSAGLACLTSCATTANEPEEFGEVWPAEELYVEANQILSEGGEAWFFKDTKYLDAIDVFQEIIDNYPFSEYAIKSELKIADSYFDRELYEEALSYYRDFSDLHPDHESVPYTVWRSALCLYHQTHDVFHDQVPTVQAINQFEVLLRDFPDAPEAQEAEKLWRELRTKLASSVMTIGDFYMDREEYQSAAGRYRTVLDEFPGLGLDADALYKLGLCYKQLNLEDRASEIFQVVIENFEGTEIAEAAEEATPAAN